MYKTNTKQKQ